MMKRSRIGRCAAIAILVAVLLSSALAPGSLVVAQDDDVGVVTISGTVTITNPAVIQYLSVEVSVGLTDMVAFVHRDYEMQPPYFSQPITALEGSLADGATYTLSLPIEPRGAFNDVSNGQGGSQGVQIYAVTFSTNFFGDAFDGPYETGGWPASNSSLRFDPGTREVRGGLMVVWSPGTGEMFPTSFGPDGRLFTADDPVAEILPGWTVVNLDADPFEFVRTRTVEAPVIEGDTGSVDLTQKSFTEAFDALIADLRVRYALSDFKGINYDRLIARFRPFVEQAERSDNVELFKLAIFRLAEEFRDGHVSATPPQGYFGQFVGGIGLTLGEADDGVVIARSVTPGMPAARAGIERGAVIYQWNGAPITQAITGASQPFTHSSAHTRRLTQVKFLTRMAVNASARVAFRNPGERTIRTVSIRAVLDIDGLLKAMAFEPRDELQMPITARVLSSGLGYVQVTTFTENPQLLVQTWEWALKSFQTRNVPGLIIDMRYNLGGFGIIPTYFAGSFFTEPFVLYRSYRADGEGQFLLQGSREIRPAPVQWEKPVAVLIGPSCASACELFAAALARNPDNLIVGSYPTFGIAAGLFGPWLLPGGIRFNAPVVQPRTPEGEVFIENVGVTPTVRVPVTVESLLSEHDHELIIAEKALQDVIEGRRQ